MSFRATPARLRTPGSGGVHGFLLVIDETTSTAITAPTIRASVRQAGLTTTADGRWALYVTVAGDTAVPIASVESQARGFPVVYDAEPDEPP